MFELRQDLPLAWGLGGPNRLPGNCTFLRSFTAFVSPDLYRQDFIYVALHACYQLYQIPHRHFLMTTRVRWPLLAQSSVNVAD